MVIFDIETGPLSDELLRAMADPFVPPPRPGEFDPASVKYGRLGEEKKAEKLKAAEEKHTKTIDDYSLAVKQQEAQHWGKVKSKAALSPLTGEVLAVGYLSTDNNRKILDFGKEGDLLDHFWKQYEACRTQGRQLVGHNIYGFDIPFLIRRSWIASIDVPSYVIERGRYIDATTLVDTMQIWGCGQKAMVKLNALARAFGVGGKPDGVDGGMFADLLKTNPEAAKAYLGNDLEMTRKVAERMGLI